MKGNSLSKQQFQPKVSVILPSLNVRPYIEQCLESVLCQSLEEIEIICVDAHSSDGTLDALRHYANTDSRIHLIISDRKSYGYQVNLGLDHANGDYIGIIETDDYIDPDMFEPLYCTAASTCWPDVVKSGFYKRRERNLFFEEKPVFPICAPSGDVFPLSAHYELLDGHPSIWACIYKKSFLDRRQIRMNEVPGAAWVDNPFLYRTLCEAVRIAWVNQAFYHYRVHSENSSSIMKDCSVPLARVNEMKDYLDNSFPDDLYAETALFKRTVHYFYLILKSPYCRKEDLFQMCETVHRFHLKAISTSIPWVVKKIIFAINNRVIGE